MIFNQTNRPEHVCWQANKVPVGGIVLSRERLARVLAHLLLRYTDLAAVKTLTFAVALRKPQITNAKHEKETK